jgi:hypothetical protein
MADKSRILAVNSERMAVSRLTMSLLVAETRAMDVSSPAARSVSSSAVLTE